MRCKYVHAAMYVESHYVRNHLIDACADGRIILKLVLQKYGVKVKAGCVLVRNVMVLRVP
jgi:hypothetical protein